MLFTYLIHLNLIDDADVVLKQYIPWIKALIENICDTTKDQDTINEAK